MHSVLFLCCCIEFVQATYDLGVCSEVSVNSSCQSVATKNLIKSWAHMLPLAELAIE